MTATIGRMPNVEKTPRRTIRVDAELWLEAQRIAGQRDETLSDVIRQALKRYIKQNKN